MDKVLSKNALLAKQAAFQWISWMSCFFAIGLAVTFVVFLFVPNSGTAPAGTIFMSYVMLAAMPTGFFCLYRWSRKKVNELDIELANWDKRAEEQRQQAERKKIEEERRNKDKDFSNGIWPFSSNAFYQRCTKNNITSIDTPYAEQKVKAIAKSMLLDAGISEKCISECLTLSRIQKLFDEAVANINRAAAEKERQQRLEEERKRTTPVQSKFYGVDKQNFELATKLAKAYGTAKRKAMLEAQLEPKEKALAELDSKLEKLRDDEKNKYKNAAIIQTVVPQEDKKDWGLAGGIAHGLGGAALGAAVVIDTMRENAEIEARNQARREQNAALARQIIDRDYKGERKEAYAEFLDLEAEVKPLREELLLTSEKIVFDNISTHTLSQKIKIANQRVSQYRNYLGVSFDLENNYSADASFGTPVVLDGIATAKIYCGEVYVGSSVLLLPLYGVEPGKTCRISGLSTHYLEGKYDYRVEINFENLWIMEK